MPLGVRECPETSLVIIMIIGYQSKGTVYTRPSREILTKSSIRRYVVEHPQEKK